MDTPFLNEPTKDYNAPMHTAEHVLNGTMVRLFGCERSFSNHIEKKKSKCDYKFPRNLTPEETAKLENQVNKVLQSSLPVSESFITQDEALGRFNLKRLPENASPTLRIISIGEYDHCLCIGKHVANTSEVGAIKIISTSHENGVLRIRYKLISDTVNK